MFIVTFFKYFTSSNYKDYEMYKAYLSINNSS